MSLIDGGTRFGLKYDELDVPTVIAEYYIFDRKLIAVCPQIRSLITFSGGILDNL